MIGAPEETRTPKIWLLRPTRIPIPSPGQYITYKSGAPSQIRTDGFTDLQSVALGLSATGA
jgi:hypothetical protein